MAMENSDTVMPTYRNPGRLAMADNTEAGTDVLWRDPNGYGMWLYICRQNWQGKSLRGACKGSTGVGGANDVVSGGARGYGGTGMSEGIANGDG